MVSFFRRLDGASRKELESSIKVHRQPMPLDEVARTLYGLRSEFMHDARLIVELSGVKTLSQQPGREITLPLERLERIFERGVLLRFAYPAPASWPK